MQDKDRQRDLASQGGKAAHQKGTAHEWTHAEAKEAGRKGGEASRVSAKTALRRLRHRMQTAPPEPEEPPV